MEYFIINKTDLEKLKEYMAPEGSETAKFGNFEINKSQLDKLKKIIIKDEWEKASGFFAILDTSGLMEIATIPISENILEFQFEKYLKGSSVAVVNINVTDIQLLFSTYITGEYMDTGILRIIGEGRMPLIIIGHEGEEAKIGVFKSKQYVYSSDSEEGNCEIEVSIFSANGTIEKNKSMIFEYYDEQWIGHALVQRKKEKKTAKPRKRRSKKFIITKESLEDDIEYHKENIIYFQSRGSRGSKDDFESLARCELLLGNMKKAREYFEESDKSWLWYLDHNRKYIKEKWNYLRYLECYEKRILILFFSDGHNKAKDFVSRNLDRIKKNIEEWIEVKEKEPFHTISDEIAFRKELLLYAYLMTEDAESAMRVIQDIYYRFEKSGRKTFKKGSDYPLALHANLIATVVNGIIENDKELFLNGFKELLKLKEDIIVSDKHILAYADTRYLFFLEMARHIWPNIVMDSPVIPEKLRSTSYFDEI